MNIDHYAEAVVKKGEWDQQDDPQGAAVFDIAAALEAAQLAMQQSAAALLKEAGQPDLAERVLALAEAPLPDYAGPAKGEEEGDAVQCSDCEEMVEPWEEGHATPCGTFCGGHFAEHKKACEVCRAEFGQADWEESL